MNIYLIHEDGESYCIKANSMTEACSVVEGSYLDDMKEYNEKHGLDHDEKSEMEHYQINVLQSCALIGELKN